MRRIIAVAAHLIAISLAHPVLADSEYPSRPIRLVVGFTAGGPTDIPARIIADKLSQSLGQRVIVENKPGAGGKIATVDVLSQPRDGYNLLLCTYGDVTNIEIQKNPGYALEDIQPISQITKAYYAIAVPKDLPANNLRDFVDYAKQNKGTIAYGHVGPGSVLDLVPRRLEKIAGIEMNGVPYRGTAEAARDLVTNRIQFMISPMIVVLPFYQSGDIKYLGVTSPERLAAFPNVPTAVEQGFPLLDNGWLGICAGSGTPSDIVAKLNREVAAAVATDDYRLAVERTGVIPVSSTIEAFRELMTKTASDMKIVMEELKTPKN